MRKACKYITIRFCDVSSNIYSLHLVAYTSTTCETQASGLELAFPQVDGREQLL